MNTNTRFPTRTSIAATLLVLSLGLTGCGNAGAQNPEPEAEEIVARIPVATQQVQLNAITSSFRTTATLEAREETDVVSKANGLVEEVLVEEGDYVQKGQILARIRDEEYQIQAAQARAELNSIQQELSRMKEMAEQNMISEDSYQKLRFSADLMQARYDMAALNLAETEIRAPISGYIAKRY
ncbi:MAG TPA: efflux RND transporter periplasmic adaptor subunit, partial [Pseudidiomarina sp.]|nr:efflux RND transporter periplasmic adaptor subunit [Pseudidiomarina sp.]